MLDDDGGDVVEDEGRQVESEGTGLEDADDGGERVGCLWKQVPVVAGDFCPPGIHVRTEGKRNKIVEFVVEVLGNSWCCKQGRQIHGSPLWKKESVGKRLRIRHRKMT